MTFEIMEELRPAASDDESQPEVMRELDLLENTTYDDGVLLHRYAVRGVRD